MRYQDQVTTTPLWDQPLAQFLAPGTVRALAALGPTTVGELLRYYPRRYVDRGVPTPLSELVEGERVTVIGEVQRASSRRTQSGKSMLEVTITDSSQQMRMVFFAGHPGKLRYHQNQLVSGRSAWFSGEVKLYRGELELVHPAFDLLDDEDTSQRAAWPQPVYRSNAALESWQIHKAVAMVLGPLRAEEVEDPLPEAVRDRHHLLSLVDALHQIHEPHEPKQWQQAAARLRFEEAFVLQVELARRRADADARPAVPRLPLSTGIACDFDKRLPFTLTGGQLEVGAQIAADLAANRPMYRLLQGDVGAGKTIVALRAMLQVVAAGGQAALLAPTEVLAAQHQATLRHLLGDLAADGELAAAANGVEHATQVGLVTGSLAAGARKRVLEQVETGEVGILVGTHALLSDDVRFHDLGLVVIDEQHRFGVEQRDVLRGRQSQVPHMLVMTATPIPRTVAMTVFGDLDTSVLADRPVGRLPVTTHVVPADRPAWMDRTWQRVAEAARSGARAYVVASRIDGNDCDTSSTDETTPVSVVELVEQLCAHPALNGVNIGLMHGRLTTNLKERAFADFASGAVPVLVSTTVIEVGVDVPQATIMVIMDADRFGLSQLHQLRGRVGRGSEPGLCLLVSNASTESDAGRRLAALAQTSDGFELARLDLELRREGDVLGSAQSGTNSSLRLLRVVRDEDVIVKARAEAQTVVAQDPQLVQHPNLAAAIAARLGQSEDFLDRG